MFGERGYLGLVQTWYHGPTQFDSLSFLGKQNHICFVWSGLSRSQRIIWGAGVEGWDAP